MARHANKTDLGLIAELNDLLHLEHDAQHTYTLAIEQIEDERHRQSLERFKADHDRHLAELPPLIQAHGGAPMNFPHPETAPAKLATQAAGSLGGDAATVLAFRANERQARDKYQRFASRASLPADVSDFARRAAADEARHYAWAVATLDALGVGEETAAGKGEKAFEVAHARMADVMEAGGRQVAKVVEGARRGTAGLRTRATGRTGRRLGVALVAAGAGFVAVKLLSRAR